MCVCVCVCACARVRACVLLYFYFFPQLIKKIVSSQTEASLFFLMVNIFKRQLFPVWLKSSSHTVNHTICKSGPTAHVRACSPEATNSFIGPLSLQPCSKRELCLRQRG